MWVLWLVSGKKSLWENMEEGAVLWEEFRFGGLPAALRLRVWIKRSQAFHFSYPAGQNQG